MTPNQTTACHKSKHSKSRVGRQKILILSMLFHNLEDGAQADFCKEIVFHDKSKMERNIKNIRHVEEA
jgi:hypothetical protein